MSKKLNYHSINIEIQVINNVLNNKMNYDQNYKHWDSLSNSGKKHIAHFYLEKPAIFSISKLAIENTQHKIKNILFLGCGSGGEINQFLETFPNLKDVENIIGIDNSFELIKIAKDNYPKYNFFYGDLENLDQVIGSFCREFNIKFDFIFSSLTLHYIEDWLDLFVQIKKLSKKKSPFVFSTHHPVKWGSESQKNKEITQFKMGYKKNKTNNQIEYEIYGDYLTPRAVSETLFGKIDIIHYHKPIGEMINVFIESGLEIKKVLEPLPILAAKSEKPDFWAVHSKIPLFILFWLVI